MYSFIHISIHHPSTQPLLNAYFSQILQKGIQIPETKTITSFQQI